MKRTYCQGKPNGYVLLSRARIRNSNIQATSKPQNKLGLRFLFLACLSPCSYSFLATPALQHQRLNPGQLITSQAWANRILHDCSSVLELFYQMDSVFIRKERRKGRRNEERKGRRRGGERITVFTVLPDVLRVGYGGRLHSYLELEPRQGLGFLSAFPRIFLLHSCVIIFL